MFFNLISSRNFYGYSYYHGTIYSRGDVPWKSGSWYRGNVLLTKIELMRTIYKPLFLEDYGILRKETIEKTKATVKPVKKSLIAKILSFINPFKKKIQKI